jgi:acetylornithine deacetylase
VSELLTATLDHLRALVAFDTRNPPRHIDSGGIFAYLQGNLPGFEIGISIMVPVRSVCLPRAAAKILFNVHLIRSPIRRTGRRIRFRLRVGAAAALVAAANATQGDAAFLFTSDEEANDPRCIAAFLARRLPYDAVLVAEPTHAQAVLAHRGISSVLMRFAGTAGHASAQQSSADSAVHQAIRWGNLALAHVDVLAHERFGGLTGLRFNIGRVDGGIKANMIAPAAELRFGLRPLPSTDVDRLLQTFREFADPQAAEFTETFRGPSLPAGSIADAETRRLAARDWADALQLPIGNAVDFWTEASLFSQAGHVALVYGPGDIAQAHAADEWVGLDQLKTYADSVCRIIHE